MTTGHAAYAKEWRNTTTAGKEYMDRLRKLNKAKRRADQLLRDAHPIEYEVLLAAAKAEHGIS